MLWLTVLTGCKAVDPLPEDLDGAVHWLWGAMDAGAAAEVHAGVVALDGALGGDALVAATDGSISRLTAEQVAPLGITDRDPADAAALFIANRIDCGLDDVVDIFSAPNQDELYPGVYAQQERTYDGDRDAFLAGDVDDLRWSLTYQTSILGSRYTGGTEAYLRRVRPDPASGAPFDDAYLVRFHAPEPAVFEEGAGKSFTQDYQFEVYWAREDGATLHAYAMWREANWGAGFTSEEEGVQRLLLNGMKDWDDDTARICAER
jgi:hypothetical protein